MTWKTTKVKIKIKYHAWRILPTNNFFRVEHSKPRFQTLAFILMTLIVVDKMIHKGDNLACQF